MSNFRERLTKEKKELDEKIEKLDKFIASDAYDDIEGMQMSLLNIQLTAMMTYSQCLLERVAWLEIMDEETPEVAPNDTKATAS